MTNAPKFWLPFFVIYLVELLVIFFFCFLTFFFSSSPSNYWRGSHLLLLVLHIHEAVLYTGKGYHEEVLCNAIMMCSELWIIIFLSRHFFFSIFSPFLILLWSCPLTILVYGSTTSLLLYYDHFAALFVITSIIISCHKPFNFFHNFWFLLKCSL